VSAPGLFSVLSIVGSKIPLVEILEAGMLLMGFSAFAGRSLYCFVQPIKCATNALAERLPELFDGWESISQN
ncbi:MAG TPA: hypothetical protein PKW73_05165, partial [Candidatus Obscuribacter sp.]|nr:hypothetical protein [Candidatus Obscuribacter sp.]